MIHIKLWKVSTVLRNQKALEGTHPNHFQFTIVHSRSPADVSSLSNHVRRRGDRTMRMASLSYTDWWGLAETGCPLVTVWYATRPVLRSNTSNGLVSGGNLIKTDWKSLGFPWKITAFYCASFLALEAFSLISADESVGCSLCESTGNHSGARNWIFVCL